MEKSIIATGKTLDMAIDAALAQLGLDRDSVSVKIIENAKSGFFGIGAVPAKVEVTYEVPDEEPAPALSSASRSKPKKVSAPVVDTKPETPVFRPEVRAEKKPAQPEKKAQQEKKDNRKEKKPQQQKAPRQEKKPEAVKNEAPKAAAPKVEYKPAEPGSKEEKIEQFIKGLLEHMGNDAVPQCTKINSDTYQVELVGENLGALIGRRGETLDAIQHLTNYSVNRENDKHTRINVDAENYRKKREESLERLAVKVANKVLKYRRNVTLEPMNAYERHVIHAALQDTPNITTFSTGTEPNRRIVVAYAKEGKEE